MFFWFIFKRKIINFVLLAYKIIRLKHSAIRILSSPMFFDKFAS